MSDEIEIVVDPVITPAIDVSVPTALSVSADATTTVAVQVDTTTTAAVDASVPVSPSIVASSAVDAEILISRIEAFLIEVEVAGLTGTLLDKLNSIPWGGCDKPVTAKKLWSTSMRGTETGDYDPWPGTNSLRDVAQGRVNHPDWRGEGILHVRMTGSFVHTAGAGETFTIELQVADVFPTAPETADVDYGMPQPFTTVFAVTSKALGSAPGEQVWVLSLDIISEGTTDNQFHQVVTGYIEHSDPGAADGIVHTRIKPTRIAIDTTKDLFIRTQFKTDYAIASGEYFRVLSSSGGLMWQRDG